MKSSVLGKNISGAEVQDITPNGIWVFVKGKEYILPFTQYPWFKGAKVSEILNLKLIHADHLFWPDLDIDLGIDVLEKPEHFPLMERVSKNRTYKARKNK